MEQMEVIQIVTNHQGGGKSLWRVRVGDYREAHGIHADKRLVDIVAIRPRIKAYD